MNPAIDVIARSVHASRAETLVVELVNGMVERHGWRPVEDAAEGARHVCLVGADTAPEARALVAEMPGWQRPNTLVVGIEGELFQLGRPEPRPGSIGDLLEAFGLAGYLPARCLREWRPLLSGFAGRKDLMRAMRTNCLKGNSSRYPVLT